MCVSVSLRCQDFVDAPLTIPARFSQNLNIDWTRYQVGSPPLPPLSLSLPVSSLVLGFGGILVPSSGKTGKDLTRQPKENVKCICFRLKKKVKLVSVIQTEGYILFFYSN